MWWWEIVEKAFVVAAVAAGNFASENISTVNHAIPSLPRYPRPPESRQ